MALPNYGDIVELIKKGATLEAQEKIMELRDGALDLQEQNLAATRARSRARSKCLERNKLSCLKREVLG